MKKIMYKIKKNIIFILGFIIGVAFSSTTVYAAITAQASEINYIEVLAITEWNILQYTYNIVRKGRISYGSYILKNTDSKYCFSGEDGFHPLF